MHKSAQRRWQTALRPPSNIAARAALLAAAGALVLAGCAQEGAQDAAAPRADAASGPAALEEELPVMGPERVILGFGDSLMAGYGLAEAEGYPEVLQRSLRGRGVNARVIDAGVSGETTAGGRERIGFVLDNVEGQIDLAIIELGGNDLLRQLPPDQARQNLAAIIKEVQSREIPVLLMGMRAPPNLGGDYVTAFDAIYPGLAEEYGTALVPFFMESVYDRPRLMQGDRVHPTAEGIEEMVAATVDAVEDALPDPASEAGRAP